MRCPRCQTMMEPAIAMNGNPSEFWQACPRCNTFVNTYQPQPHQTAVHKDDHTFIGNFGAYGTGKTTTSREELYKHILITPNANVIIGAKVTTQYEQTIKREIEADLPRAFIDHVSIQKSYFQLKNGARVIFRPFDDPDKLRSYNLTMFIIIEASETAAETLHQLKTRLRNLSATYVDQETGEVLADWRKGIVESNPDSGWVRTDMVLTSDVIYKHGNVKDDLTVMPSAKDPYVSSHVASTDVNRYLPATFIDELTRNKPAWWVSRYVFSSFSYAEGLVYPHSMDIVVPYYEPPKDWPRIIAADYGLADNFVYLLAAVDERRGKVVVYKEAVTNNRNIDQLSALFYQITDDVPVGGWYTAPILDPKSGAKRDYDKKTLYDHFLDHGIAFQPGHIQLEARIYRTNTYIESNTLEIMENCTYLIGELREYKFPERKLETRSNVAMNKPVDKNNHAINPLEWICMVLPSDPRNLTLAAYGKRGRLIKDEDYEDPQSHLPFALRDEPEGDTNMYTNMKELF